MTVPVDPAATTRPLRVVILAPVHAYDDIRVFRKEAVTLAAAGHDVVLYARTPDGEPLHRDGVTVRPVRYRNRVHRFAQLPVVGHRAWREGADVYHLHNPDTLPIAFALKLLRGRRVVYDTHEDFRTEILLRTWLPAALRRPAAAAVTWLERQAGRRLDAVIVTQEQLRDRIPAAVLIGNPPIVDEAAGQARVAARGRRRAAATDLVLGYVGGLSADRGLPRMLALVAELARTGPAKLLLIGPGVNDDALAAAQADPRWQHVDHRGELAQEQAFEALDDADAGLILFADVASHRHVDPNKIYEYLALGLPFIASEFGDWVRRFGDARVGLFVDPAAPIADVAAAVRAFTDDRAALAATGRRGLDFVRTRYSWQRDGAPALLALYRRICP